MLKSPLVAGAFALGVALLAGTSLAQAAESMNAARSAGKSAAPVTPSAAAISGYFAVVTVNGTRARHKGAVGSSRLGVGTYEVLFRGAITRCAFTGTLGLAGFSGSSPSGEIAVVGRAGTNNGVFVQTFNSAGASADRAFHLVITC